MATMNICLSHDAAFRWLVRHRNPRITGNKTTARVLPCTSPFVSESRTLRSLLGIEDGKLEVLVRTSAGRRDGDCLQSHYSGNAYPAGSFVKVPVEGFGAVCCSSPELTFLQIAVKHTLLETVYMGYALCSSYRIDADAENGIALREGDDEPLTSAARIGQYLAKVDGAYGTAKARRALAYVRDGSISPTESAMAMALSMPRRFGGFAAGDVVLGENVAGRGCLSLAEGSGDSGRMLTVRSTSRRRDVAALNISLPDGVGRGRANGLARGINGPEDPEELPVAAFCAQQGGTSFDRGSEAAGAKGDRRAKKAVRGVTASEEDARDSRKTDRGMAASKKIDRGLVTDEKNARDVVTDERGARGLVAGEKVARNTAVDEKDARGAATGKKEVCSIGRLARGVYQEAAQGARAAQDADREAAASHNGHGGLQRRAILVRPEQVHEFDAYVQLCEKVARRMRRRNVPRGGSAGSCELLEMGTCEGMGVNEEAGISSAFGDEAEAKQRAKEARQLARRVELWQTLVCFSAFRQSETGSSVNVFDPPADHVCERRGKGEGPSCK